MELPVAQVYAVGNTDWSTDGTVSWSFEPETALGKARSVDLRLSLPNGGGAVAYLFTNTSTVASLDAPLGGVFQDLASSKDLSAVERAGAASHPAGPDRLEFHGRPTRVPVNPSQNSRALSASYVPPALLSTFLFQDESIGSSPVRILTPTTLRLQRTIGSGPDARTLNIWVADDCWGTATGTTTVRSTPPADWVAKYPSSPWNPPYLFSDPTHNGAKNYTTVNQAMITALADRFLKDGVDDVYGWETSILGKEWFDPSAVPASLQSLLVDGHGEINIFVKNLNPDGTASGILQGYFYSLNNTANRSDGVISSNGKILFALDANTLADPGDDGVWDISDHYPAEAVSTLAHEFQHMIRFYQKNLLNNVYESDSSTWVNEMCSMLIEDLVADKLGTEGPRGVPLTGPSAFDYSPGSTHLEHGRLPLFNFWHDQIPLTGWGIGGVSDTSQITLASYSSAYAFGAWLIRNYGGPHLLRELVRNSLSDQDSVVAAVNAVNGTRPGWKDQTWNSLVRGWGLAAFLRSNSVVPGLKYAADSSDGGAFGQFAWKTDDAKSGKGDVWFRVGSIDLGNYAFPTAYNSDGTGKSFLMGPYVGSGGLSGKDTVWAGATYFYRRGRFSGTLNETLSLPPGVALTVVVAQ